MSVTWNPADKDASITLSSGNCAATKVSGSGTYGSVRATKGINAATDTAYFEAQFNVDGSPAYAIAGVMPASSALNSFCGADAAGYGYQGSAGNIVNNSAALVTYTAFAPITRLGILIKAGALYFGIISGGAITWQGGADPATDTNPTATGLTGIYYPTFSGINVPSSVTGYFSKEQQVNPEDWPAWGTLPASEWNTSDGQFASSYGPILYLTDPGFSGVANARTSSFRTQGKLQCNFVASGDLVSVFGVADGIADPTHYPGQDSHSVGVYAAAGAIYYGNTVQGTPAGTLTLGDEYAMVWEFSSGTFSLLNMSGTVLTSAVIPALAATDVFLKGGGGSGAGSRTLRMIPVPDTLFLSATAWDHGSFVGDAHFLQTTTLLHFNDAAGSTTFTDDASSPQTWTAHSATTSAAAALFGSCGLDLYTSNGYITTPATTDFGFQYSDFTVEGYAFGQATGNNTLFDTRDVGVSGYGLYKSVGPGALSNLLSWANDTSIVASGTTPFTTGWNHWALTKKGDQVRGFLNGNLEFTSTDSRVTDAAQPMVIGANSAGAQQAGCWFEEVRVTLGWARYIDSFVVPIKAFPDALPNPGADPFFSNVLFGVSGAAPLANLGPGTEYPQFQSGTGTLPVFFRAYQVYQPTSIYFQAPGFCAMNVHGDMASAPMPAIGANSLVYECFFGTGNSGADPYSRLMQSAGSGDVITAMSLTFLNPSGGALGNLTYSTSIGGVTYDGPGEDMGWTMTAGRHYLAFVFDRDSSPGDVIASLYVDSDTGSGFSGTATRVYTRTWTSVAALYNDGQTAWCNGGQSAGPTRGTNSFMEQIRATLGSIRGYSGASIPTPSGPFALGGSTGLTGAIIETGSAGSTTDASITRFGITEETATATESMGAVLNAANSLQEFASADDASDATAGTSPSIMIEGAHATDVFVVNIAQFTGTLIEALAADDVQAQIYGKTGALEETGSPGDVVASAYGFTAARAEPTTAQESTNSVTDKPVLVHESAAATEASATFSAVSVSIAEAATAADSVNGVTSKTGAVIEAADAEDAPSAAANPHVAIAEAATATVILATASDKAGSIVEAVTALDRVASSAGAAQAVLEQATATDAPAAQAAPHVSIVEAATATDRVVKSASAGAVSIVEATAAADRVTGNRDAGVSVTESTTATDAQDAVRQAHYLAVMDEIATALDIEEAVFTLYRSLEEKVQAQDYLSVLDVSGYFPNNPAVWLAEYRRHVWIAGGRN